MGIDYTGCEALLRSMQYVKNKRNVLTLGRQGIHIHPHLIDYFLEKYNYGNLKNRYVWGYCESLFIDLGFNNVDSVDNSDYENANIIHNLNTPININFKKYDYILDAGTSEHIFNAPQLCDNIINLLNDDGIYVSITPNNNLSGHGMYQFSPEFYLSVFSDKYGMKVEELYIAKVGSGIDEWINVNSFENENKIYDKGNGRNNSKFDSLEHVYIIAIIKKISNDRVSVLNEPPNQYSYENIDWKKK